VNPQRGFLQAITAQPDEDAPRLIYADWLEDSDQAQRAELIRAQVELARLPDDSQHRREVAFRARQLLDQHAEGWARALGEDLHDWQFVRGQIEKVGLMAEDLQEQAAGLFAVTPLRRLWVTELYDVEPLRSIPASNRLTGLDLCGNDIDTSTLEQLAGLEQLGNLRVLGLLFNRIDDTGARLLCEHPFFQGLSLIRLGANPLSPRGRRALRVHFGDRVSFACERDEDHLYAIQNGYIFSAGFGHDFTQVLQIDSDAEMRAALFDHAGNLLGTQRRAIKRKADRDAARQAWLDELEFRPATIQVKQFRFREGEGIYGFCEMWCEVFDRPNDPERESARRWLDRWLFDGQFSWGGGPGVCWLDRTGAVTDT
jgi:uncharacterized protein (TIGR02996 family)